MRLRTACDLDTVSARVTAPSTFTLPKLADIEPELRSAIAGCKAEGLFADPAVTRLSFAQTEASAKGSRKASKKEKDKPEGEGAA